MHKKLLVILVALFALSLFAGCPKKATPTGMEEGSYDTGARTATATETRQPALVGELRDDHAKVKNILADLEKVTDQQDATKKLNDLREALVPHIRAEERVVYPAMTSLVGQDMIETSIGEHRAASQMLMDLEGMSATAPTFKQKGAALTKAIETHVAREEGQMFPKGEQMISTQQWDQMKDQFDKTREATLDILKHGGATGATPTTTTNGTKTPATEPRY